MKAAIVVEALKHLHNERVVLYISGLNSPATGILTRFDEKSGLVVLKRPSDHVSVSVSEYFIDASDIVMVGHDTGIPK